jgi:hypothetical protein
MRLIPWKDEMRRFSLLRPVVLALFPQVRILTLRRADRLANEKLIFGFASEKLFFF